MRRLLLFVIVVATLFATNAHAQSRPQRRRLPEPQPRPLWPLPPASLRRPTANPKLRLSFNGGAPISSSLATQDFTIPINQEDAVIVNDIDLVGGGFFDAGIAYRLGNRLWTGVSFSFLSRQVESQLSAQVPHPFYFNQRRQLQGTVTDLADTEMAGHISLGYEVPVSRSLELVLFGGPSYFMIAQDLVTDIDYDSSYPFDTATLASVSTETTSGSAVGFNVGTEVNYRAKGRVSVGGLVRYSRATVPLSAAAGNTVDVDAGGLMVGGGIRFTF